MGRAAADSGTRRRAIPAPSSPWSLDRASTRDFVALARGDDRAEPLEAHAAARVVRLASPAAFARALVGVGAGHPASPAGAAPSRAAVRAAHPALRAVSARALLVALLPATERVPRRVVLARPGAGSPRVEGPAASAASPAPAQARSPARPP